MNGKFYYFTYNNNKIKTILRDVVKQIFAKCWFYETLFSKHILRAGV